MDYYEKFPISMIEDSSVSYGDNKIDNPTNSKVVYRFCLKDYKRTSITKHVNKIH